MDGNSGRKFALTLAQMEQRKSGPRGGLSPWREKPMVRSHLRLPNYP
jgi:hypothetical protein